MNNIKFLIGISGSGKSNYASTFMKENSSYRRVNRDKIRECIFGYSDEDIENYYKLSDLIQRESEVSDIQNILINRILDNNFDVIIDNTNLNIKYLNKIMQDFPQCNFSFDLIETPLEICIYRDSNRLRTVGEKIIRQQFSQLNRLKQEFDKSFTIIT